VADKIIEIKNVSFAYSKQNVLEKITLDIFSNDFLAIIGSNGGGKSTLLKLILGLLKTKTGKIIKHLENDCIGYVPQNTNLNIDFPITALELVLMGHIGVKKTLFGYSKDDISCAMNSLEQVNMDKFTNSKIGDLSGGQRQRVFIARALCANPKIILLDEPTANIDIQGQKDIYELLKELNRLMAIVLVSHDVSVLLNYAKNVVSINKNMAYHDLENIQKKEPLYDDKDMCEIELLTAFNQRQCKHTCEEQ